MNTLKYSNQRKSYNLTIHPNFVGHHKCGYANCPVCKTAVTNSGYWHHIKSHPGHENDSPPQRMSSNPNTRRENKYGPEHRSFDKNKHILNFLTLVISSHVNQIQTAVSSIFWLLQAMIFSKTLFSTFIII